MQPIRTLSIALWFLPNFSPQVSRFWRNPDSYYTVFLVNKLSITFFILQAMWSDEVLLVELVKSDRGLGFSILDYQVKSVTEIRTDRSLVFGHFQSAFY